MIIFLDYDDVVNSPMWYWDEEKNKFRCNYNFPKDNKVNNFQAVQWISEICEKFNAQIVVSSDWRRHDNYKECLINGGLRQGIKILGKTPFMPYCYRQDEIKVYLEKNNIGEFDFLVIDDDEGAWLEDTDHFIHVQSSAFGIKEFFEACEKIEKLQNRKKFLGTADQNNSQKKHKYYN